MFVKLLHLCADMFPLLSEQHPFSLADITVHPLTLTVRRGEQLIVLQQKPMEVLAVLAARHPALVSREQLIELVWDGNIYVGEKALTHAIWQLRQLFEQLGMAEVISTVRKKGYRLLLTPQSLPTEPQTLASADAATVTQQADGAEQTALRAISSADSVLPNGNTNNNTNSNVAASGARTTATSGRWRWISAGLALTLLGWLLWFVLVLFDNKPSGDAATVVSRQQGWSLYPAVSVDGQLLVYSHQQYGQIRQLFALDLADTKTQPRQLTFSPQHKFRPVLSPNGLQVYYSSRSAQGECEIRSLDLQTLQEHKLRRCDRYNDVYLDLAPDGRFLYFNASRNGTGSSFYRLDLQQPGAPVFPLPCHDFCDQRGRDLAAAPDGQSLALTRRANRLSEEIFLYDISSGRERQLTFGHADIRGLEWLPDNKTLLFSSYTNGRGVAYLLDTVSGSQTELNTEDFSHPSRVSANGTLYFQHDNSMAQLGYLRLNSASAVFPLTAGDQAYEAPHYHAGRQQLVFISTESGQSELWLADKQLQNKKQLTRLGGGLKYPRWSHDGRRVLFVSRKAESVLDRLTIVDVETGQLTFVKTGYKMHGRPTWWHDDSAVLLPHDGELVRFDLVREQAQVLTSQGADYAQMPDNKGFYFSKGRRGLWWQTLDAAQPRQVLSGEQFGETYAWAASSQGVYFLRQQEGGVALCFWSAQSGQQQQLVLLPAEQINLSATPAIDEAGAQLLLEYSPIPRIDILRWQLP